MNKQGVIGVIVGVLLLSGCAGTNADVASSSGADGAYLQGVRAGGINYFETFTDEQLITLGHQACDEYKSGLAASDMRLINGELEYPATSGYRHSETIAIWAAKTYCP